MITEGEEGGSDDEEDEEEDLGEKLQRLYDTRNDLFFNLRAVEQSLADLGYAVDTQDVKAAKGQPQTGIRIKGELSFRGRQMAAQYFALLDEDKDGFLSWDDMRAMRSLAEGATTSLGLLHSPPYLHWESWRMYMDDAGIATDAYGRLDVEAFVQYRALIEPQQPLARELRMAGLGFLPALLQQWSTLKVLIAEVLAARSEARAQDERGLGYDEVQFVLCNAGIVYTRPDFFSCMLDRALREKTMEALLLRHIKRGYAGSPTKYTSHLASGVIPSKALRIEIEDLKYIKPSELLAWFFAARPEPKLRTGVYRSLILVKNQAFRAIRYIDQVRVGDFPVSPPFPPYLPCPLAI